jgi:predicted dithiol-disulfide oxidoreductase (DUF899 family)
LAKEKAFTRLRDALSRQRRELLWERVEQEYLFDRPDGKQTLAELFDGRTQLVVYHFMSARMTTSAARAAPSGPTTSIRTSFT